MKLRYYLRGMAVGILITTVILTIANADKHPLSDAEIRARALELGMVYEDSVRLSDLSDAGLEREDGAKPEDKAVESEDGAETLEEPGADAADPSEESGNGMGDGTTGDAGDLGSGAEDGVAEETGAGTEVLTAEPVIFVIRGGATSYTVSKELEAAGLVEDAAAFDTYLCDNGYAKKIRSGTYEIVPGTGEAEIAEAIAH